MRAINKKRGGYPGAVPDGSLRAGVAKIDITNRTKGILINDLLYVKVLVLDDGKTKAVIITMDVTAIGGRRISQGILPDVGEDFLPNLRNRIQKKLKIPGCNVLVNASHTHPPDRMLCNDREQLERAFEAVLRASENMMDVKIGYGIGHEDRISINRNLRLKNGRHWTIRHTNPSPPDDQVKSVAPIDPDIGIIRIDRADGTPLAVIYNFACHPSGGVSGTGITAGFPGIASKLIEETLGNGAIALFLQGTAGDICEVNYKDSSHPRNSEPLGILLGLSTLKALRKIKTGNARLRVLSETIRLPRRTDIPERLRLLQEREKVLLESLRYTSFNFKSFLPLYIRYMINPECPLDSSYRYLQSEKIGFVEFQAMDNENRINIEKYLKNIQSMEELAKIQDDIGTLGKHQAVNKESGERTIEAEVQGIRIGDCVLISSPAELLVEVGLNVKRASPFKHTFVAAFSNGYMHYGPPAAYYDKGGYEVTECLLAPGWQKIYERKANEIIRKL